MLLGHAYRAIHAQLRAAGRLQRAKKPPIRLHIAANDSQRV